MKRNIFLIVLLACFALNSSAQVTFGPMLGLNLADVSVKAGDESLDTKMKTGFHIGGVVNIPITEHFSVMPGLLYSAKGYKMEMDLGIGKIDVTRTLNYLEIPINAVYSFGEAGGSRFMINAGPYLGYCIGGKDKADSESESIKVGSGDDADVKAMDFGLNVGVGYQLPMGLFVRAQYGLGLANIAPGDGVTAKNGVIGISVGYFFGGK